MFLRVSYAKAKQRREARIGYVTVDGFWQDPEGYVDKIVWPNYVAEHAVLFEGGNVELSLKEHVSAGDSGVKSMDSCDQDMGAMLSWAVDLLMSELPKLLS